MQTEKYVKSRVKLIIISHLPACLTLSHLHGCFICIDFPSSSTSPKEILLLQDPEAFLDPQMNVVIPSLDTPEHLLHICLRIFGGL